MKKKLVASSLLTIVFATALVLSLSSLFSSKVNAGGMCTSEGHGVKCCWVLGSDGTYTKVCRKGP